MSEINVTPLVDVMLVLLIIFMVTAPLLTAGLRIDLPCLADERPRRKENARQRDRTIALTHGKIDHRGNSKTAFGGQTHYNPG